MSFITEFPTIDTETLRSIKKSIDACDTPIKDVNIEKKENIHIATEIHLLSKIGKSKDENVVSST
jgi:hypothetical protein